MPPREEQVRGTARTQGKQPEHAPVDNPERLGPVQGRNRASDLFATEIGPSQTVSDLTSEDHADEDEPSDMASLIRQLRDLQRNQTRMAQENSNLRKQVHQLTRVPQERAPLSTQPFGLSVEQDSPAPGVGQRIYSTPASSTTSAHHPRSARFPDPDKFSDGTPAEYDRWRSDIIDKLDINQDWFPHERAQCAYIRGRVAGRAADHLIPWVRQQEAQKVIVTVESMLYAMDRVFVDRNASIKARGELRTMKPWTSGQDFRKYVADFTRLANVGNLPIDMWKEELHAKITGIMLIQMASHGADPGITFDQYVEKASDIEHAIHANHTVAEGRRMALAARNPIRTHSSITVPRRPVTTTPAPAVNVNVQRSAIPYRQISAPPAAPTPSNVICYNCNRPGHYANACTQPKAENKAAELVERTDEVFEDDYLEEQYHDADEEAQLSGNGQL